MEFTFYKDELLRALKLLEPYAVHEQTELDSEPYFDNKVVFGFDSKLCYLSIHREELQIHINIPYFYEESSLMFCIELIPLIKKLEHTNAQLLRFEEDTFFGFLVYSVWQKQKKFLFEVKAYSARKIKGYKISNSSLIDIRKSVFVGLLSELHEYTSEDYLRPSNKYIWFYGNGKEYIAIATNGHKLAYNSGITYVEEDFCFGILGKDVPCLLETLSHVGERLQVHMELEYNTICGYDNITGTEINILHSLPDVTKWIDLPRFVLDLKSGCVHSALCSCHEMKSAIKRVALTGYNANVFLHFTNGHVNIHSYDRDFEQTTCSEFYKVQSDDDDFVVEQKAKTLLLLLERINTIYVRFCVDSHGYLHVLNEQEAIFGNADRFSTGFIIEENERKILERKDFELARDNKYYREHYFI